MPLTPEQIAEMDKITGLDNPVKSPVLSESDMAEMDKISGFNQDKPFQQVAPTGLQQMSGQGLSGALKQAGMMARSGFQGITAGAGDELLAGAASLPISALSYAMPSARNVNPSEAYDIALQTSRNELKQGREDYPKSMLGAEIGGNIATGLGVASTAPIKALTAWAGRGSLASRASKIYASALAPIAGSMYAEGEGGAKNRLENASMAPVYALAAPILGGYGKALGSKSMTGTAVRGASTLGVGGAALGAYNAPEGEKMQGALEGGLKGAAIGLVAAPALRKANEFLGTKSIIPNSEQLREQASKLYKLADTQGGVLKPQVTNDFVDALDGLKPQSEMGKLVSGDSEFTKTIEKFSAIRDKPMTLQDAQELDEALGDAIDGFTELGKVTKQGKKLLDVQTALRNKIEDATEDMTIGGKEAFNTWNKGKKLWATSRKLNDIERIIQRAEGRDNPTTILKNGFSTLLNNPQRLRGYSKPEIEAIREAARSGFVTDTLKGAFGSRLGGIILGATQGPLAGVGGAVTNAASRGLAEKAQVGKALKAAEMVATGGKGQQINPLITVDKIKQIMKMSPKDAKMALKELENPNDKLKSLPKSVYLNSPKNPTKQQMDKYSYIDDVDLNSVRGGQNEMDWEKFNKKQYAKPLIKGYSDMPVAIKLENGEHIIIDGNHRTVNLLNKGEKKAKMHIIEAKKFDPENSGRKEYKPSKKEIDDLLNELER